MKQNIGILVLIFTLLIGCKEEPYKLYSLEYSSDSNMEFCRVLIKDNNISFFYEWGTSGQDFPISNNNQIRLDHDIYYLKKSGDNKLEISSSNEVARFKRVNVGDQDYIFKVDRDYLIDKYSYLISNENLSDDQVKNIQLEFANKVLTNYDDMDLIEEIEPEVHYNPK